jgi:hypothetical protein
VRHELRTVGGLSVAAVVNPCPVGLSSLKIPR